MHHLSTVFEENKLRCAQGGLFADEHSIPIPLVLLLLKKRACVCQAFLRSFIEVLCYWRNEASFSVQQRWVVRGESSSCLWILQLAIAVTLSIETSLTFNNHKVEKSCLKGWRWWKKLLPCAEVCKQSCVPNLQPELLCISIINLAQQASSCDNFIMLYWLLRELKGI